MKYFDHWNKYKWLLEKLLVILEDHMNDRMQYLYWYTHYNKLFNLINKADKR